MTFKIVRNLTLVLLLLGFARVVTFDLDPSRGHFEKIYKFKGEYSRPLVKMLDDSRIFILSSRISEVYDMELGQSVMQPLLDATFGGYPGIGDDIHPMIEVSKNKYLVLGQFYCTQYSSTYCHEASGVLFDLKNNKHEPYFGFKRRHLPSAISLNGGNILILGGDEVYDPSVQNPEEFYRDVLILDPKNNKTKIIGQLENTRIAHKMFLLDSHRVILFGGYHNNDYSKVKKGRGNSSFGYTAVEVFDISTGAIEKVGELLGGRLAPSIVNIDNNQFLVVEGMMRDGRTAAPAVELFNLKERTSTLVKANLHHYGPAHAIRLDENRIMISIGIQYLIYDIGQKQIVETRHFGGKKKFLRNLFKTNDGQILALVYTKKSGEMYLYKYVE